MRDRDYLNLEGITASYGGAIAVESLTLQIAKGELLSLLGPSGCGKTTTLRMIAGFVPPVSGAISLAHRNITALPPHRRNIGVVFQSYALFPHLTALDNVGFGLRMRNLSRAQWRARAGTALESVGLAGFESRHPGEMSGGQQQRVALARALVIEPHLLLLDEPLSNLDANLRADMRAEIRSLQQRLGITTVFVTHDQQEALAISDRIAVMQRGLVAELGTPRQLCDAPKSAFTAGFLGARTVVAGKVADGRFTAPGLACTGAPEGATQLVLRASRLRLADAAAPVEGALDLAGTLTGLAYLGETFEADVRTAAGTVRLIVPSDTPLPALGSPCRIRALPGGTTFIRSPTTETAQP